MCVCARERVCVCESVGGWVGVFVGGRSSRCVSVCVCASVCVIVYGGESWGVERGSKTEIERRRESNNRKKRKREAGGEETPSRTGGWAPTGPTDGEVRCANAGFPSDQDGAVAPNGFDYVGPGNRKKNTLRRGLMWGGGA
jgi:hypothetical protein